MSEQGLAFGTAEIESMVLAYASRVSGHPTHDLMVSWVGLQERPIAAVTHKDISTSIGLLESSVTAHDRPPLALRVVALRVDQIFDMNRMRELIDACDRYVIARKRIPDEWFVEMRELNDGVGVGDKC